MQVGAQIDASLPKDALMENVVTITHVHAARLLVYVQAYDCFRVCYFFVCIKCVNLDQ